VIVVLLVVIGVVVTGALTGAVVVVSVASRSEDRGWTLVGPAPGPAAAAARRIVNFHSEATEWPRATQRSPAPGRSQAPARRFPAIPLASARPGPAESYRTS
jgi:hypothetical protein